MKSIPISSEDDHLSGYDFFLPEAQIAQYPAERGASRLLVVDRFPQDGNLGEHDAMFADLPEYLPPGALLAVNNSRVLPARLPVVRPNGGKAEFLLLTPLPLLKAKKESATTFSAEAECLLKPAKRIKVGDTLAAGERLRLAVLGKKEFGQHRVQLTWESAGNPLETLQNLFCTMGHLPLPPYIHRADNAADRSNYQTVYARPDKTGSVAAPTAGLHFTENMRSKLQAKGFLWTELTLHVGYGTFSPVRCANLQNHVMHPEYVELSENTVNSINHARAEKRPIIAVGTTSARVLEGVASMQNLSADEPLHSYTGWLNLFIHPGFSFRVIDGLITNFHLPESTLLMLVSAFAGRERMLRIYADAVRKKYRFFSYGDAMLIR